MNRRELLDARMKHEAEECADKHFNTACDLARNEGLFYARWKDIVTANSAGSSSLAEMLLKLAEALEKISDPEVDWIAETRPGALCARQALAELDKFLGG